MTDRTERKLDPLFLTNEQLWALTAMLDEEQVAIEDGHFNNRYREAFSALRDNVNATFPRSGDE